MIFEEEKEDYTWVLADIEHDNFMIRGGVEIIHREKINILESELTIKDMEKLVDYVWQGEFLIPLEMMEGE